jgi:hypothetical protein
MKLYTLDFDLAVAAATTAAAATATDNSVNTAPATVAAAADPWLVKTNVLNTLVSNPDSRYISKHPSNQLLGITKHLLMIVTKLSSPYHYEKRSADFT